MQIEKGIKYSTFIKSGLETFLFFFEQTIETTTTKEEIKKLKRKYQAENFEDYFQDFCFEFEENVHEFQDRKIIYYYLEDCFGEWDEWDGFEPDIERTIIRNHYDVEFLLKLKKALHEHISNMTSLIYFDPLTKNLSLNFEKSFYDAIIKVDPDYEMPIETLDGHKSRIYFVYDYHFDFASLKSECEQLKDTSAKIQLIEFRLIEFNQWQVEYDEIIYNEDVGSYRYYTQTYYPKFKDLCYLHLVGLRKKAEFENTQLNQTKANTNDMSKNKYSVYQWTASDTDLIELITAIHTSESIKRIDSKNLTQKELFEYFQDLFNVELKDIAGKQYKAGNRKNGKTPYLDRLKLAFEHYVQKKEERLEKRK